MQQNVVMQMCNKQQFTIDKVSIYTEYKQYFYIYYGSGQERLFMVRTLVLTLDTFILPCNLKTCRWHSVETQTTGSKSCLRTWTNLEPCCCKWGIRKLSFIHTYSNQVATHKDFNHNRAANSLAQSRSGAAMFTKWFSVLILEGSRTFVSVGVSEFIGASQS